MKLQYMIVIAILILGLAATAAASNIMEGLIDGNRLNKAPEQQAVQTAIEDSKVIETLIANSDRFPGEDFSGIAGPDDLAYGDPYKVALAGKELLTALRDGKGLSSAVLSLPHIWEVPVIFKNNPDQALCSFTVAFHQGTWRVVEIGGFLSQDEINFASSKKKQLTALKKNAIDAGSSYVHLRIASAKIDYMYMESNHQEFFLKMNHRRYHDRRSDVASGEKKRMTRKEVLNEVENRLKELAESGKDH